MNIRIPVFQLKLIMGDVGTLSLYLQYIPQFLIRVTVLEPRRREGRQGFLSFFQIGTDDQKK